MALPHPAPLPAHIVSHDGPEKRNIFPGNTNGLPFASIRVLHRGILCIGVWKPHVRRSVMMKSGTDLMARTPGERTLIDANAREAEETNKDIVIRSMEDNKIEGLEAYPDGISFRSSRGLAGGSMIEMVLCNTILVDAEVVGVIVFPKSAGGGYFIRARFCNISPQFQALIHEEVSRLFKSDR